MQLKEHWVCLESTQKGLVPLGLLGSQKELYPWLEVHSNWTVQLWEGTQSRQGEEGAALGTQIH